MSRRIQSYKLSPTHHTQKYTMISLAIAGITLLLGESIPVIQDKNLTTYLENQHHMPMDAMIPISWSLARQCFFETTVSAFETLLCNQWVGLLSTKILYLILPVLMFYGTRKILKTIVDNYYQSLYDYINSDATYVLGHVVPDQEFIKHQQPNWNLYAFFFHLKPYWIQTENKTTLVAYFSWDTPVPQTHSTIMLFEKKLLGFLPIRTFFGVVHHPAMLVIK